MSANHQNRHPNALIHEKSPYLQQHAYNPVHWMPWSDAAFEKAQREQKPIFLSIGYSTCHWCHVRNDTLLFPYNTFALSQINQNPSLMDLQKDLVNLH